MPEGCDFCSVSQLLPVQPASTDSLAASKINIAREADRLQILCWSFDTANRFPS